MNYKNPINEKTGRSGLIGAVLAGDVRQASQFDDPNQQRRQLKRMKKRRRKIVKDKKRVRGTVSSCPICVQDSVKQYSLPITDPHNVMNATDLINRTTPSGPDTSVRSCCSWLTADVAFF